jgi:plastin-1
VGIVARWANALDIEGVCLRRADQGLAVLRELADGTVLLRVLDAIEPGIVQWGRANLAPRQRKALVENCNYVVNLGRAMEFGLSDVAGVDIVDSHAALVVPFLWQLMRYSTLRRLSEAERGAFSGFAPDEAQVLEWCNERVAAEALRQGLPAEQEVRVRSFGDSELASGLYLLYLVASLRPGCVAWAQVTEGESREEQFENALYVLSVARKMGAHTSCGYEDIMEVRPRAIMLFCAAVVACADALEESVAR